MGKVKDIDLDLEVVEILLFLIEIVKNTPKN
jgi:hypothetical protein